MNLYNQLHGENPQADELLNMIMCKREDFGRYRDIYLNADGTRITVWTRCGGSNRPYFTKMYEAFRNNPYAIRHYDDKFDATFAYIEFKVSGICQARAKELATGKEPESLREKTDRTLVELESMNIETDPRTKPLVQKFESQQGPVVRMYDDDMPEELRM